MVEDNTVSDITTTFLQGLTYEPDDFQFRAMHSLDNGNSVLVAAPTGSGKTLVAEYAIHRARSESKRAFYTTPIKALSNQKFRDLGKLYGFDRVGLVTGDNAINPEASVVVMTTEVLRNMIYASSDRLSNLGVVILDEVHYLQDTYRGPVWEEVIIQLEPTVQLVCLSATVSNADEVGRWLSTVRGTTDVVVETRRPVELINHFAVHDAASDSTVMHRTVVGSEPNQAILRLLASAGRSQQFQRRTKGKRLPKRFRTPSRPETVELLDDNNMLPAIVFIFSRAQCEDAVSSCIKAGLQLTDPDESGRIQEILEDHTAGLSPDDKRALSYDTFLTQVRAGIACHHAGMIPMFKEAVEECFIEGLVKVVFATETLAVGINMPARAVVIEKLTKYTGEHHALLRASEFAQLTGRAGRRGLDDIGHAVTLWNPFVSFDQVVGLAMSRSFQLTSAFRPTFNMAVNMIRRHSERAASHLLNLSFAQFQADRDVVTVEAKLQRKREDLSKMLDGDFSGAHLPDDQTAIGIDIKNSPADSSFATEVEVEIALRGLRPGDVVMCDAHTVRGRAVVLTTASRKQGTKLGLLTPSKKLIDVVSSDFRSLPLKAGQIALPVPFEPNRSDFINETQRRLVKAKVSEIIGKPVGSPREEHGAPRSTVERKIRKLQAEIVSLEASTHTRSGSVWARFQDVIQVLETLGYVRNWTLTDKGEILAGVFHESDLLIVEVLNSSILDNLTMPDLVAVLSSVVFEPRGGDQVGSMRGLNDTVRQRIKRIEKISVKLQDIERSRGLAVHRSPDGGIGWEMSRWALGDPLSKILDPYLTPGDFVRCVRQMIDLLQQLEIVVDSESLLAQRIQEAIRGMDRGVVAASTGAGAL
jgi:ATP-dependent RNA helicase HelY